jgi:hypothetical protein
MVWPLSSTAEGMMSTVVPVNAELTATETWAQMIAGGVPVLLSSTLTEYVADDERAPVENEEDVCPTIGVEQVDPVYHWYE